MDNELNKLPVYKDSPRFCEKEIPARILERITDTTRQTLRDLDARHVGFIVIRGKNLRERMATITGKPSVYIAPVFITYFIDMNKTYRAHLSDGSAKEVQTSLESIMAATLNAGIAQSATAEAARAAGLGALMVNNITLHSSYVITMLKMPMLTFPLAGLSLGFIDKPRPQNLLPLSSAVMHHESYDRGACTGMNGMAQAGKRSTTTETTGNLFSQLKPFTEPDVRSAMAEQGFKLGK